MANTCHLCRYDHTTSVRGEIYESTVDRLERLQSAVILRTFRKNYERLY